MKFLNEKYPDVPTDIHGFLKYCGIQRENTGDDSDPSSEEILDKEVSKVEKGLSSLGNGPTSDVGNSFVEAQGNARFIEREHGALTALLQDCLEPQPTSCSKETGGKQRLQKWSRGHLFIVRGGGIIDKWSPLFKSESPSQVFIIVLSWLFTILKCINPLNWDKIFVSYDNMCYMYLDGLKAAQALLPWPSPWDKAWMSVKKIIDSLHIRNVKREI
ncbi:uncharacterized protein [Montipora foliosa]|uniref:uncharacterized protein n=1 Tax=Montipora foliosa TaxID=591990 RepID=UPI0035F118A5